jgi:hypothetical protein
LRFVRDFREGCAGGGQGGCGHGAFHQRSAAQFDVRALLPAQQFQRSFGAQHGAAEIHENQHSVLAVDRFNGLEHLECIGTDGVFGIGRAPGSGYAHAALRHLARQIAHTLSQLGAVRDNHQPDHERQVSAAA